MGVVRTCAKSPNLRESCSLKRPLATHSTLALCISAGKEAQTYLALWPGTCGPADARKLRFKTRHLRLKVCHGCLQARTARGPLHCANSRRVQCATPSDTVCGLRPTFYGQLYTCCPCGLLSAACCEVPRIQEQEHTLKSCSSLSLRVTWHTRCVASGTPAQLPARAGNYIEDTSTFTLSS